jgi:hypothetical protein
MDIERNVTIEHEDGELSATDRPFPYTTYFGAASSIPKFSKNELDQGWQQISDALEEIEAESQPPED